MAFGDHNSVTDAGPTNNNSLAYNGNVTAGNLLLAFCHSGSGVTLNSVSDSLGNAWNAISIDDGSIAKFWFFYAYCATGGANTHTISLSAGLSNHMVWEHEGPFSNAPLQDSSTAFGATNVPSTGNFDGVRASTLYVSVYMRGGGSVTAGTGGWTQVYNFTGTGAIFYMQYAVAGAATTNPAITLDSSPNNWVIGASFNPPVVIRPDAGSYTLTGTAAPLVYDRVIIPDAGSYAVTGDSVALQLGARRNPSMYITGITPAYAIDLEVTSQQ